MKTLFKGLILIPLITLNMMVLSETSKIVTPVQLSNDTRIEECLERVGVSGKSAQDLAKGIRVASVYHNITPEFLIALFSTESSFKKYAVSCKNYHGYGQIPYALYEPGENSMISARIMREKLVLSKGNVRGAISLYKGYGSTCDPRGLQQADKVLRIYKELSV